MMASTFQENCISVINGAPSWAVFFLFDLLDNFLCIVFRFVDQVMEEKLESCQCSNPQETSGYEFLSDHQHLSETLYRRRNIFRQAGFLRFARKLPEITKKIGIATFLRNFLFPEKMKKVPREVANRWSDCGCKNCVSWTNNDKLNVIVKQPSVSPDLLMSNKPVDNVIFIHGFLASSSYWTNTVFKYLPETTEKTNYRFFAVDLLGFGDSPKPRDCRYSLQEHVEMIEKSVILPNNLTSFHVVAHSMGCIVAVALAAKFSGSVKSVALVAPPYFGDKEGASCDALDVIAEKKFWPPTSFFSAMMAWYEHIARGVCFVVCRHHRTWEKIIKIITWRSKLPMAITELTKHTHQSSWHSMHNVLCGGAKFTDKHLESLINSGVKISVVQGDKDAVVPIDCLWNMKAKFPAVEVEVIAGTDHSSVIMSRREVFVANLVKLWASSGKKQN
ncbi:hypothetical protein Bca52824_056233 [Brassica carinata]|uniref:AB hydrolase-1 domain-containing protein n=2 Tax=Brassica TaxID=3705 RepID=A0A0D3EEN9_BRAOL|nr:PREDICTED: uncharacterized protein LOC106316956 [Brassica oleracea var. oleracea]KAG2273678.1 hypothetical protein Bca52824_056233 [Brassica carinata]